MTTRSLSILLRSTASIAAAAAAVTGLVPGCINNEDAKPQWVYGVCIDYGCGSAAPTGVNSSPAGSNTSCGTQPSQCSCTNGTDLFCGECKTTNRCMYCPAGTYCSGDPCNLDCYTGVQPPPSSPPGCTSAYPVDCGNGTCCPNDYPVCCSSKGFCATSSSACALAGHPQNSNSSTSSGASSGAGSGGASSGAGGSGGGGSCPCQAASAPAYAACNNGDIAACSCAAAYLDSCGIQNSGGCCNAGQESACISQLKSDCASQLSTVQSLASGVPPECTIDDFPACN